MMLNETITNITILPPIYNQNEAPKINYFHQVLTYLPLFIIGLGLTCNTTAFLIFRLNSQFKTMSSMVYLSFVTITDTLSLFVWNLDHYIYENFKVSVENSHIIMCHISMFQQFFSLQSSAILLSMLTIDRYFTVVSIPGSFASKLPFRTARSAFYWSIIILAVIAALNSHVLVFPRQKDTWSPMGYNCFLYKNGFRLFPIWENVHLVIFSVIPFLIMIVFNVLLIKSIFAASSSSTKNSKSLRKKTRITISLVAVTILFLAMTLPSTIFFGYLFDYFFFLDFGPSLLILIDSLSFLNSSSIFFITIATNSKFRKVLFGYIYQAIGILTCKPISIPPSEQTSGGGTKSFTSKKFNEI